MKRPRATPHPDLMRKARLLAGADFWHTQADEDAGIPSLMLTDGPHGLRKQAGAADHLGLNDSVPATCFPAACASACSFDEDLLFAMGRAMGQEARREGVAVILGPGVNIKRHPLCGRNFEYFSEDPLLSGRMGAALVRGIQSQGVGACVKHFAANSQEHLRMVSDSIVDERALREVYLRPFQIAIKRAQPWLVMAAYNRLNGTYCAQSRWLLTRVLRSEWGFDGAVVTDWGALSDSVPAVKAGLDLAMPGPRDDHAAAVAAAAEQEAAATATGHNGNLATAVERDESVVAALDAAAERVAKLARRHTAAQSQPFSCDFAEHLNLARRIAEQSAVLLENDGTLPLPEGTRVAVLGAFAKNPRYQGAGSSKINPVALDCAWDALEQAGVAGTYAPGYDPATGETDEELLAQAEAAARSCPVAVVFAGLPDSWESEGSDRSTMRLPEGQNRLVERVCAANPRTVVVLMAGSPVELPWRAEPGAILLMYLTGCQGGAAIADLLAGRVNPSGKLAETWPASLADTALQSSFPETDRQVLYRESLFVGYRYYNAADVAVAYPFGHGLSYTRFTYRDPSVRITDEGIEIACTIENAGDRDGAEAVQVYVHPKNPGDFVAPQALVAFAKPFIAAGESARMRFVLGAEAFSRWDPGRGDWIVERGAYEIRLSASSRDVRLRLEVELDDSAPFPTVPREERYDPALDPYFDVAPHGFTDEAFHALYGKPLPQPTPTRPYTKDSPIGDLGESVLGRIVLRIILWQAGRMVSPDDDAGAIMDASLHEMPLRSFSMGGVPANVVDALAEALNGHLLRAIRQLLSR